MRINVSIYQPRKDERLSRPGSLTYSGRFTHISGHPSAAGRAQDSESSPVRDQCFAAVPGNQLVRVCTKGKGKGLDTCYSATYVSQTRDQQRFTISEVAADWQVEGNLRV